MMSRSELQTLLGWATDKAQYLAKEAARWRDRPQKARALSIDSERFRQVCEVIETQLSGGTQ